MQTILKIENLSKKYWRRTSTGVNQVLALDDVSLTIDPAKTLAVVGESGSGKTTLAFCIAGFEKPTEGIICFDGSDMTKLSEREHREKRSEIQLIFQDPASSLNPRWPAFEILTEPLRLQNALSSHEMKQRALLLLTQVGLSAEIFGKFPNELSGGQRQRLAIARAIALQPKFLILDEALSALDCSVQAQIANLLVELQQTLGMTYMFITHDLVMAGHLADEIAVMNRGRIVERGQAQRVLTQPAHETTRQLLASLPRMSRATFPTQDQR